MRHQDASRWKLCALASTVPTGGLPVKRPILLYVCGPPRTAHHVSEGLSLGAIRLHLAAANASEPCSASFWRRKLDMKLERQQWAQVKKKKKKHKGN